MHGGVPSASISEEAIMAHQQAVEKLEKAYMRKYKQIEPGRNPKPVRASVGSTVHFDNDTRICYDDDCVRRALAAQRIRRMEDRLWH